ncbi:MAG: alpha/beta hydrolase [Stappiaceae bacterium]
MQLTRRMFTRQMTFWAAATSIPVTALKPAIARTGNANMYDIREVTFTRDADTLVGQLFVPAGNGPFPGVAIMGPVAFVKEQSPLQYASRLAQRGLAVLIFDPRYHGASSGEPRRFESGKAKINDLRAACCAGFPCRAG